MTPDERRQYLTENVPLPETTFDTTTSTSIAAAAGPRHDSFLLSTIGATAANPTTTMGPQHTEALTSSSVTIFSPAFGSQHGKEESLTARAIRNRLEQPVKSRKSTADKMLTKEQALERLDELVGAIWADNTWNQRQHLWSRFQLYCKREELVTNATSAVIFVLACNGAEVQGQLNYAKTLASVFRHLGLDNRELVTMAKSLEGAGGTVPQHQAERVTKERLWLWAGLPGIEVAVKIAVMLAWKTASRWDEISNLTASHFIKIATEEIIIDWDRLPKGRRNNPYKPSRFTVVVGANTEELCNLLLDNLDHTGKQILCSLTTSALDNRWRRSELMAGFSAHSIKRGALSELIDQASQDSTIDAVKISLLAKHEHVYTLAASTIRYGADPIAMARLMGTQHVTKLL
jgi:integrase